jgi:hypothetical protein
MVFTSPFMKMLDPLNPFLFMVYIATLSVAQTKLSEPYDRMIN